MPPRPADADALSEEPMTVAVLTVIEMERRLI